MAINRFHAPSLAASRTWLEKNHEKEHKVLMIRHKVHTGKPTFSTSDAMDEAICFGWIDTTLQRIDDDRYGVRYVKRVPNSRWSHNTVARAERLIAEGKMAPAGHRAFKDGMRRPLHDSFPKIIPVPADLRSALANDPGAKLFFDGLAPSYRRTYTLTVVRAKLPATRKKRIAFVIERRMQRKKPMA